MRYAFWLLACGLVQAPCFAGKARVEVPKGADLSQYRTYQWLPPKALTNTGVVDNHPELGPLVKEAVNKQLMAKGLKEVESGGDLQVATIVLGRAIPQLEAVVFGGPDIMYYDTPIATMGRYNREGTLVVNLIDSKTKKSAWTGLVTESIRGRAHPRSP